MNNRVLVLAGCLLMMLPAGCGVPAQEEPHAVELPRSPLVQRAPSVAPSLAVGDFGEILCLVRDGRLLQTVRRVAAPPAVQQQLDELVAGPTPSEQTRGLSSTLAGLTLTARKPAGSGVVVDIAEPDESNARSDEILAYGQVVCTLTARADIRTVVFTREGQRLEVPRADGGLTGEPLKARDYADLIGPS